MKNILILFSLMWVITINAQFGPQQIISTEALGARSVFVTDLDGDNLKDVISANKFDSSIFWFKNLDGSNFDSPRLIASLSETINVYATDIDGDDDMDVLAVAPFINQVVWYENLDGLGNFGSQNIISAEAEGASVVIAADIDGDEDIDVISGSNFTGLAWYENLDGLGNFGPTIEIDVTLENTRSIAALDIDGDTDLDIVATSSSSDVKISWYKNLDGLGGFGNQRVVAENVTYVLSIYGEDFDGDEDIDIVAATPGDNKIAWFENVNGQGTFGSENIITTQANNAWSVFAADLDNDDDIDILSGSAGDNKIAWYENLDGQANFGSQQIISIETEGVPTVFASDVDNDTDMDVFSSFEADHTVAWYENLTILSIDDMYNDLITISPNPVKDVLLIENSSNIEILSVKAYDVLGRLVLKEYNQFDQINVSHLNSGVLFVHIETDRGTITNKIIKE